MRRLHPDLVRQVVQLFPGVDVKTGRRHREQRVLLTA
jgi:hypothetical protein